MRITPPSPRFQQTATAVTVLIALTASLAAHAQTHEGQLICGSQHSIAAVPLAENTAFSDDGRLFVSGGENVYEVLADAGSDSGYALRALSANHDNFTGLAVRGGVLYAASFEGLLYAAQLDTEQPALLPIHNLGMNAANGMSFDEHGALYIANGPFPTSSAPDPRIVRLTFAAGSPMTVSTEADWLSAGLVAPNGLRVVGDTLYWSDSAPLAGALATLRAARIGDAAPSTPPRRVADQARAIFDDFVPYESGFLAAGYWRGSVVQFVADGAGRYRLAAETRRGRFANPSSVRPAVGPLFPEGGWLVTEKGALDGSSEAGNQLSLFQPLPCGH